MKREKKGKLSVSLMLVVCFIISNILSQQVTGFLFNPEKFEKINIVTQILKVVIVFTLFCVANWSITTLMSGEGSFKDIVMTVGYACLPLVLIQLPVAIISNVCSFSEVVYLNAAMTVSWIWFFWLLFAGIMTIHQYSIGKMLFTIILTVAAMAALVFVYLLFMNLFTQLVSFVFSIYKEISLKI